VNIAGGNPINVSISYDGKTWSTTLTDTVTHATFATNATMNLLNILGTNTAYVGLTGADGGVSSKQIITNFQFASVISLSGQFAGSNAVAFTWPNSAGGLVLQQAAALNSAWTTVTNPVTYSANGQNQVVVPTQAGSGFYRLATP
jgi:hypothetical protein